MQKMSYMQDNVLASSSLIVNSYQELNRAIFAAGTTLENAINAFNQLNHTKFLENVIEDAHDATKKAEIDRLNDEQEELNRTQAMNMFEDMYTEKDKITFALEIAI